MINCKGINWNLNKNHWVQKWIFLFSFIREAYLKDIHKIAPEYLTETFTAESDYLPEDGYTEKGLIQVKIQVAPHHKETPGIRIYYPYKDSVRI